jgi:multidrug efflux pump subunit AcrA (membrane-fusion protein)
MKELQLNEIARKAKADAVMNDINKIQTDVMTQKIDPTRVWSNMSTGNRVLAGISIFLGGVAGGMQGTENRALGIIQDAVNKDIDAQKAEIGKKQNMLSLNMAKYNNINDAAAATKAQLLSITQAQINQAAAKMGSKQALAAAQVANGQIDLQKAQLVSQISTSQAAADKLNNPAGISPKDVMKLSQDIRSTLVQMPNGNYIPAFDKESARSVKTTQEKMYPIKSLMSEAGAFMDKGGTYPLTTRNKEAKRIEKNILIELKNLKELGQLTEGDMGIIEPLLPSLGDFFQADSRNAISSINRQIDARLNAVYSANIPGLNPSGRQSRETPVFGK